MKYKTIFLIIAALLFLSACPDSPTNPKDENPYKQEAIDWPSLAESPWPMYRHDPQNTGRSPYPGAQLGIIVDKIPSSNSQAGVVMGPDSTLYFYHEIAGIYYFQATDYSGNIKWSKQLDLDQPSTVPVVLYDGSIVSIGKEEGEFIRITASGDTLWQCFIEVDHPLWAENCGITVGLDTAIYYITSDRRRLVVINKDGTLKWSLTDDRIYVESTSIPVFSPDGKTIYLNGDNGVTLLAVDTETHSIKWTYGEIALNNSPLVDNNGNIFINNGYNYLDTGGYSFFSLDPDGSLRWKYQINGMNFSYERNPSIDWDGNVYFVSTDTLYSFTNNGDLRWKIPGKNISCPLILDGNNNVYGFIGAENGLAGYYVSMSGELIWDIINTSEYTRLGGSPIIVNNSILVPGWRSEWIYVIQ